LTATSITKKSSIKLTNNENKIHIVSYVSFDGYDKNLYTETKTFTDRSEAEAFWYQSCKTARADARCEDSSEYEEDWKPIEENNSSEWQYDVWRFGEYYHTRVELTTQEIETTPETKMVIGEYLYNNIACCLTNLSNETDACRKQRIIRHILHSLRENCITED